MTPRKHAQIDWITLAAAGIAGMFTGVAGVDLGWAEQLALAITVGLTVAVVLEIVRRLVGGNRHGA
jgi:hypothetical protein